MSWDNLSLGPTTSGSSATDSTTYTTASITIPSGRPVIIFVARGRDSAVPGTITSIAGASISGAGLESAVATPSGAGLARTRLEAWSAVGTGTAGALTITLPDTANGCLWFVSGIINVDTTRGTNGGLEIGAGAANAASTWALNLFPITYDDPGTRVIAACTTDGSQAINPVAGFVEQYGNSVTSPNVRLNVVTGFETQTVATWNTASGTANGCCVGIEWAATGSAGISRTMDGVVPASDFAMQGNVVVLR